MISFFSFSHSRPVKCCFRSPSQKKKKRQTTKHCLNREAIGISIVTTTAITHTHKKKKKMKKEIYTRVSHIGRGHHFLSVFSFQIRIFFFFPFILKRKTWDDALSCASRRGWGGHKWLYWIYISRVCECVCAQTILSNLIIDSHLSRRKLK